MVNACSEPTPEPSRLDRLDGPYWRDHYSGARRVLHADELGAIGGM